MNGVDLYFDEEHSLSYVDSTKARIWIDIFEMETNFKDIDFLHNNEFYTQEIFLNKKDDDILYRYIFSVNSKSRDMGIISIMNKLAYIFSKSENSFVFNDNGILPKKDIYFPNEIKEFIYD